MIVATAGHVDHGKTSLLKALTGIDTDRLPEEKQRGLSIDLGFAYSDLGDGVTLGFVDVPGHERFIRNMLAGVAGIDFALLLVAVDDGVMPQTVEHLTILKLLGVTRGAVVLSKVDRVPPARAAEVANQVRALLAGGRLDGAPMFEVSSTTGQGVAELKSHLEEQARRTSSRDERGNFRLAIDRAFSVTGAGIVVTGSVFSGRVRLGDQLVLSPSGRPARVRAIHAQNRPSDIGLAGQRCAINIAGADLELSDIARGDWLLDPRAHAPTNRLDAELAVSDEEARALKHWTPAHLHLGAVDVTCRVAVLRDGVLEPGKRGLVQLLLDRPIGSVRGDRFILRDQSARRTIGGGEVIDPFSVARGRARPRRLSWLEAMARPDPVTALSGLLEREVEGIDLNQFVRAWNLNAEEFEQLVATAEPVRVSEEGADWAMNTAHWATYRQALTDTLADWHHRAPERQGLNAFELTRSLRIKAPAPVLRRAVAEGVADGSLARRGSVLHLPSHRAQPRAEDLALWRQLEPVIRAGGLRPPIVRELAADFGIELKKLEAFLARAVQLGWLVRVAPNRYYPPTSVRGLGQVAVDLSELSKDGSFEPAAYRDAAGVGRNLTIEILEFLDRAGLTHRVEAGRWVRAPLDEVFPLDDAEG